MRELSKKRKKAVPVQGMQNESGTIFRQSGVEAALAQKPYMVAGFRTGRHMTVKERPRRKRWSVEDAY